MTDNRDVVKRLRKAAEEARRGVHSPGHAAVMAEAADLLETHDKIYRAVLEANNG